MTMAAYYRRRRRYRVTRPVSPSVINVSVAGSGTAALVVALNVDVLPETDVSAKLPIVVGNNAPGLNATGPASGPIEVRKSYVVNATLFVSAIKRLAVISEMPATGVLPEPANGLSNAHTCGFVKVAVPKPKIVTVAVPKFLSKDPGEPLTADVSLNRLIVTSAFVKADPPIVPVPVSCSV
jgi:hypothetical protein